MYDIYAYFDFDIGYFIVATKIIDSRYLTSVLAAAYGSFGLSDDTSGQRASGTSAHKVNYNPELGKSLKKLHSNLVRITHSGKRMTVFRNVGREAKRTNTLTLESGNETRWVGKSCDY